VAVDLSEKQDSLRTRTPEMLTTRNITRINGAVKKGRAWQPCPNLICEARQIERSGIGHGVVCAIFGNGAGKEEELADEGLYQGGNKLA
jgi:hypothetical protein